MFLGFHLFASENLLDDTLFVNRVFNMMYPIPAYKTLELG